MTENRQFIQHLRNGWTTGLTYASVVETITGLTNVKDGEIVLGRYGSEDAPQVVLGVYNASKGKFSFVKDAEQALADILNGANEITNFKAVENVIKNILGTGYTGTSFAELEDALKDNVATVTDVNERLTAMEQTLPINAKTSGLTWTSGEDAVKFVSSKTTVQGAIEALDVALQGANKNVDDEVKRLEDVLGITEDASGFTTELSAYAVSGTTTVAEALNALGAEIDDMDYTLAAEDGKVLRSIKQENGKVTATATYFNADDIQISAKTEGLNATSQAEYVLVNKSGGTLGATIAIPKDKTLQGVKMVSSWKEDEEDKTGYAFEFKYTNASGGTDTVYLDTAKLLYDAEFKSGLTVDASGVAHVNIATSSDKLGGTDILQETESGLTIVGVSDAIAAAKAAASTVVEVKEAEDADKGHIYLTSATAEDGHVTYTVNFQDIASAAALAAEIEARGAVTGQEGSSYTQNSSVKYISGATSLNDADIKLVAAVAELSGKTKTAATGSCEVVSTVKQENGLVSEEHYTLAPAAEKNKADAPDTDTYNSIKIVQGEGVDANKIFFSVNVIDGGIF